MPPSVVLTASRSCFDQRVKAVVDGAADGGGGEGDSADELNAGERGVLSGEAGQKVLAELAGLAAGVDRQGDDLSFKVDDERHFDGLVLGVALVAGEAQKICLLALVAVDGLHRV